MADDVNLTKLPWAAWLEEALQWLCRQDVRCIALVTILADGSPAINYYKCTIDDQYLMGMSLIEDGIFRRMKANQEDQEQEGGGENGIR